jgi:hypothetical protein
MSSIFIGKSGIRHQFLKLTAAQLATANSAATAAYLGRMSQSVSLNFIDNTLNTDVAVLLVHPEGDSTSAADRLFWIEVPTNRVINYSVDLSPNLKFDPGTKVFIYYLGGAAPTSGDFRMALWG